MISLFGCLLICFFLVLDIDFLVGEHFREKTRVASSGSSRKKISKVFFERTDSEVVG